MKCLISILIICSCLIIVSALECYWNTECKYKYFSSKTPYEIIRGDIRDSIVKLKGCEAISVWSIFRHGKRNPSVVFAQHIKRILNYKDIIIANNAKSKSSLCAQDIENLRNWKLETNFFEPNKLATEGYEELVGIGSRLQKALPELFNELQEEDYLFQAAYGHRNLASAEGFIEGFGHKHVKVDNDNPDNNNKVFAPYYTCGKYQTEVHRNPDVYYAEDDYSKTTEYLKMKDRISRKLGMNITLTKNNLTAIYDLCRYLWKGNNKPSPWCALLTVNDLKVLEYVGDLRHYYRNGYGASNYSKILGQRPLADLLTKFEQARNETGKKIVSYFTHASMLDMILVVLNLAKDEHPLTGMHRDENRKWRTTFTSTFASNLIAVLHKCKKNSVENLYDYKISFYWNERPILEMCKKGVCSWQEFEDKLKPCFDTSADICEFTWTEFD